MLASAAIGPKMTVRKPALWTEVCEPAVIFRYAPHVCDLFEGARVHSLRNGKTRLKANRCPAGASSHGCPQTWLRHRQIDLNGPV